MRILVTCTALNSVVYTMIKHKGIFGFGEMANIKWSIPCFNTDTLRTRELTVKLHNRA